MKIGSTETFCRDWDDREETLADLEIASPDDLELLRTSLRSMTYPESLEGEAASLDEAIGTALGQLGDDPSDAELERLADGSNVKAAGRSAQAIARFATANC